MIFGVEDNLIPGDRAVAELWITGAVEPDRWQNEPSMPQVWGTRSMTADTAPAHRKGIQSLFINHSYMFCYLA
jgi:hypothetical protein